MVAIPNWLGAFMVQTRTFDDVMAMVNNRIAVNRPRTQSPQDPQGWKMPTTAIVYRGVAGPTRRYFQVPVRRQTLQVETYGADARIAEQLYRTLYARFLPQDMLQAHGFVVPSLGVSVMSIQELGSPAVIYDPDTAWPRTISTWWVEFCELPSSGVAAAAIGSEAGVATS